MLLGVALLCFAPASALADYVVAPGDGVTFSQIDQTFPGFTEADSNWAFMDVDLAALSSASGMADGFLNVWQVGHGWSVQNMRVDSTVGYPDVSAMLGLPVSGGTDVTSLDAYVLMTPAPITSFATSTASTFAVGSSDYNAQGEGAPSTTGLGPPPSAAALAFANAFWSIFWDTGVGNVECADMQCGPAAAANSLHWISHRYPWVEVPQDHVPGVNGVPANSLVGQLDKAYGRAPGNGIGGNDMVAGKMKYLQDNGLDDDINVKYSGAFSPTVTVGAQSVGRANATVTSAWLEAEVKDGEDVEFCLFRADGSAHWVKIISAGPVGGKFQITFADDGKQGAAGGQRRTTVNVDDTDADGILEFAGTNTEIRKAVSESPVSKTWPIAADAGLSSGLLAAVLGVVLGLVGWSRRRFASVPART